MNSFQKLRALEALEGRKIGGLTHLVRIFSQRVAKIIIFTLDSQYFQVKKKGNIQFHRYHVHLKHQNLSNHNLYMYQ